MKALVHVAILTALTITSLAVASGEPANIPPQSVQNATIDLCSEWKAKSARPEGRTGVVAQAIEMYRFGVAHGIVIGMIASPLFYFADIAPSAGAPLEPLNPFILSGMKQVMDKPTLLIDAFDMRCGDFRNDRVSLVDLSVLSVLEIGGMSTSRIDTAVGLLRLGEPMAVRVPKVFNALTKSGSLPLSNSQWLPNTYQPSPRQVRKPSPSGRARKSKPAR